MLTAELARRLFHYDPATGVFTWREDRGWNKTKGKVAGGMCGPYWVLRVSRKPYLAHRVGWLIHYGVWPTGEIDHRNENKTDNAISNLRDTTKSLNMHNIFKPRKGALSGVRGVGWSNKEKRWIAQLQNNKKRRRIGCFLTIEEARAAYLSAKAALSLPMGALDDSH